MSGRYRRREKQLATLALEVEQVAHLQAEDAYDNVYSVDGVIRCGLCHEPIDDCECFDDEELVQ